MPPVEKGTRYVLVLKRDRDGRWYRKAGGRGPMQWIPLSDSAQGAFEELAKRKGLTRNIE